MTTSKGGYEHPDDWGGDIDDWLDYSTMGSPYHRQMSISTGEWRYRVLGLQDPWVRGQPEPVLEPPELPAKLLEQLKKPTPWLSKIDLAIVQTMYDRHENTATLNEVIVGLYRLTGKIHKRRKVARRIRSLVGGDFIAPQYVRSDGPNSYRVMSRGIRALGLDDPGSPNRVHGIKTTSEGGAGRDHPAK